MFYIRSLCFFGGGGDRSELEHEMVQMCLRMESRGPDAKGVYTGDNVALGHTRLSIIDIKTGSQPMWHVDKTAVIVFNGEIYNFKKLKAELSCHGVQFSTDSDTEVILNLYREYGIDKTLELIEGMFSFAIYDVLTRNLYLARDKFGEKPCYVWNQDGKLRFASELKAFAPVLGDLKIDYTALNYFLSVGYIP